MKFLEKTDKDLIYLIPPDELIPQSMLLVDQLAENRDWGHKPLQLEECQKITQGEGIVVAVLDTGCDLQHPDLKDRIVASRDFTGSRSGASDVSGHGTHCAGIIASSINDTGLIGTAPRVSLVIAKVLGDNGSGYSTWIANGIRWAVQQKADIISMSLGSSQVDQTIYAAVKEAVNAGVYVVAAAGNDGPRENTVGYPGGHPECVCVAAIDSSLKTATFSSRGQQVDVTAPGAAVLSTYPGGRYATLSGTSMATPYVSGVLALYLSYLKKSNKPFPSQAQLTELFKNTCRDLEIAGKDTWSGFGLVQPLALLKTVDNNPVPNPPVPPPSQDVFELSYKDLVAKGFKKVLINLT